MDFKSLVASTVKIEGLTNKQISAAVIACADSKMGDYCLPCFRFAKELRSSPVKIAENVVASFTPNQTVSRVEAVNGYANFFLNKQGAAKAVLEERAGQADWEFDNVGQGATICIDYSSINIAKPFHIGHLGTTAIGNCLYKVYNALGYRVVGINHLGDWGTQFGKLIVAYLKWSNKQEIDKGGLRALQAIYVRFHVEAESNPALEQEARDWFRRIEQGEKQAIQLFEYFKRITLEEIKTIYNLLEVKFDSWNGESFYNDKMNAALSMLEDKGLVTVSDGAKVVDLSAYDMPPCLLVKSDGASLYATRDIAAILYRKQTYDFHKCLYVVAYQQNLHFKQLFKVIELAGLPYYKDLVHVAYGMVSLEEGSMSTRKGNTVWLEDVLNKAIEKASQIIQEKNPNLPNKQEVARQVGVGAVVFSALSNGRIKDTVFSFERVLSFEGETAPYLQYTHARCCSVMAKAGVVAHAKDADYSALDNDESLQLTLLLNRFSSVVVDAADKYEPSVLSNYLLDLAKAFNKFYFEHRILSDDVASQCARLALVDTTRRVLSKGLYLLGIQAPQQM